MYAIRLYAKVLQLNKLAKFNIIDNLPSTYFEVTYFSESLIKLLNPENHPKVFYIKVKSKKYVSSLKKTWFLCVFLECNKNWYRALKVI